MNAYILDITGTKIEVKPENGKDFSLEELHIHLNCNTVEFLSTLNGQRMIVDEEGKNKNLPVNMFATNMLSTNYIGDFVVGKVLICKPSQIK